MCLKNALYLLDKQILIVKTKVHGEKHGAQQPVHRATKARQ